MDIAITGSTGLIGTALRTLLEAEGHRVVSVVRPGSTSGAASAAAGRSDGTISWDPAAGAIDRQGFEGLDAVVHLAGAPIAGRRWNAAYKATIRDSRVDATALLAATLASLQRPPRVLLSGSAIGIYGDRGEEVLTESSAPAPPNRDFLAEVCAAWEAATGPAGEAGIRVAHLRTGVVLARGGGALAKMLPLFRFGLGGRFGSGRQYWSWISLADEIAAIRFLLDHDVSGPVNLTAPHPATNAAFTKALATALGRPAFLPVPAFGPKTLLGAELASALLFSSARVVPQGLTDAGYAFTHAELAPAFRSVLDKKG